MPDDNSPEMPKPEAENPQPESPLLGIFKGWDNLPKGRHITGDEPEFEPDDPFDEKTIIKKVAQGFIEELEKIDGKEEGAENSLNEKNTLLPLMVYGSWNNFFVSIDYYKYNYLNKYLDNSMEPKILPPEEQRLIIRLTNEFDEFDVDRTPYVTSPIGRLPLVFVGSDGEIYQAGNSYELNPNTGEAKKNESVWRWRNFDPREDGDVDISKLPRVDFALGGEGEGMGKNFETKLEPEDFEQLQALQLGIKEGNFKPIPR